MAELLAASPAGLSEAQIADRFTARGAWKKRLADVLATLEAVARRTGAGGGCEGAVLRPDVPNQPPTPLPTHQSTLIMKL